MHWINNTEPQTFGWAEQAVFYEERYKASVAKQNRHIDNRYIEHATDRSRLLSPRQTESFSTTLNTQYHPLKNLLEVKSAVFPHEVSQRRPEYMNGKLKSANQTRSNFCEPQSCYSIAIRSSRLNVFSLVATNSFSG